MPAIALKMVAALVPILTVASVPSAISFTDSTSLVQMRLASRSPWDRVPRTNAGPHIPSSAVELVVASRCENTAWFHNYGGPISIYNKGGSDCEASLLESLGGIAGHVVSLENRGREGQSYIKHIVDNYDRLPPYTAFVQGSGEHNGVKAMEKIRKFQAIGNTSIPFVPIVHENDNGPILYRDADPDEKVELNREGLDRSNVYIFPYGGAPVADKARALYMALFGGTACEAPPMNFAAGAQFIASREAIRSKPKAFWEHIASGLQNAQCEELGYVLERVWPFLFDPNIKPAVELKEFPEYCMWSWQRLRKNRGDCKEYKKSEPVKLFRDIHNNPWKVAQTVTR